MSDRSWFPLFLSFLSVLGCAGCDLGTKLACNVDGDCFDGLSCISEICYKCAADKAGCACADGSCLHGMVCGAQGTCVDCSETAPCPSGLACDAGRCVGCSSDFAGCPCEMGQCGTGLQCDKSNQCAPLACADGVRNGDETDVDCGGSCAPCREGFRCRSADDCESLACDRKVCLSIESCHVRTDEFPTIQSAIDDPRCASIVVQAGRFDERVRIRRAIQISGTPSMPALTNGTVLTNELSGPVIEIAEGAGTVYLRDLQIRDGAALRGAGVLGRRDVVVENSQFIGNRASVDADWGEDEDPPVHPCGGAIFLENADLTVRGSTFVDNQAEETRFTEERIDVEASGGAICISGKGELVVESSEFRQNLATTTADIQGITSIPQSWLRPRSTASGGAIHRLDEGPTVVRDSTFLDNMARTLVVDEEEFQTSSVGGAIAVPVVAETGPVFEPVEPPIRSLIERSVLVGNVAHANGESAWARGGAVDLGGAWIRDTTFEHNWARSGDRTAQGGAAALTGGGRLESTKFMRNRVDGGGESGGALHSRGPIAIVNSVFWDNESLRASAASLSGLIGYGARVSLINSTFLNNGPGPQLLTPYDGTIRHSVVAGGSEPCGAGTPFLRSEGYNVFGQDDCLARAPAETDRVVDEPLLEVVYDRSNGLRALDRDSAEVFSVPGFPLADSPVIDGGDPTGCRDEADKLITVDSRGVQRTGPCDIGAFAVEPEPPAQAPLTAFLLREVTPRTPEFFAPDGSCQTNVTQAVAALINESITGDNDRSSDFECDGLLDRSLVLILDREEDGSGVSSLGQAPCVATHVACEDPYSQHPRGPVDFRILTEEPCNLGEEGVVVEPGDHGCIEAEVSDLWFGTGVPFHLGDAELVGELDVRPHRISNGILRGFMSVGILRYMRIPESMYEELGVEGLGHTSNTGDLLCAAELVERDGVSGYFIELGVEFEEVTLYGQGLPPIRPMGCE